MLQRALANQRALISDLANSWLACGATAFGIWADGKMLAGWPVGIGHFRATVSAPVTANGVHLGEVRVAGACSATRARLAADAGMLGRLATLEQHLDRMASDLIDSQDQLLALYNLTEAMRNYLTLEPKLARFALEAARLVKVEGAFLVTVGLDERLLECQYPVSIFNRSLLRTYLTSLQVNQESVLLNEKESELPRPERVDNLLLMPIHVRGEIAAGLGLFNKGGIGFTSPDLKLARAIAEQAGAQIESALLYQENMAQTKLQTEMKLAQSVQLNLLPGAPPVVKGLELWASSRPASEVGGDFYDFIVGSDRIFTFVVGDVSGKGMPAALLMAMTRTVIRTKANGDAEMTPETILTRANQELYEDFTDVSMFATVFVGQYAVETRQLVFANAGHSPVIYCPAGKAPRLLEADGTPLGVLSKSLSKDQQLQFEPGDVLVVGTDGLSDARNGQDEMYGYDRLLQQIESLRFRSAKSIGNMICQSVSEFSAGHLQDDDQTLVVLKVK